MSSCYEVQIQVAVPNDKRDQWEALVDQFRQAGIQFDDAYLTDAGEIMIDGSPGNYKYDMDDTRIQELVRDLTWNCFGEYTWISVDVRFLDHIPHDYVEWQESDYEDWKEREDDD